jgi:hypothetical protein
LHPVFFAESPPPEHAKTPDANMMNSTATTIRAATRKHNNVTEQIIVLTNPMKILIIAVRYNDTNFRILDGYDSNT